VLLFHALKGYAKTTSHKSPGEPTTKTGEAIAASHTIASAASLHFFGKYFFFVYCDFFFDYHYYDDI